MYAFIFFKCPIRLIIGLYLVTPIRCEAGISVTPYQPISSSIFRAALSHQEIVPRVISFRQYNSFLSIQTNQANKTGLPHYPKLSSNPSHARNYRNTDNQDICYYSVGILQRRQIQGYKLHTTWPVACIFRGDVVQLCKQGKVLPSIM